MRAKRRLSSVDVYHVVARGTGRQLIFEDDDDRAVFLDTLRLALGHTGAELYAWCLMGNHVHLLVHAPIDQVAQFMKELCGTYAQYFNKKAGRTGHLFQERYKSEAVDDDAYLLTVLRYIHDNPAKAGIASASKYAWSSYSEYLGKPGLCSTDFVSGLFSGKDDYARFHSLNSASAACLDIPDRQEARRQMTDSQALEVAKDVLGEEDLASVKELVRAERNHAILVLRAAGLSIRQTERITGIGRGAVQRVWSNQNKGMYLGDVTDLSPDTGRCH